MNKSKKNPLFDKIVMSDRYNGCYSGFKYRIVDKPFENLTQEECDIFNAVIREGNDFYSDWGIDFDKPVTADNCRLEAIEKTFENADVYAGAASAIEMPWITNCDIITQNQETNLYLYNKQFEDINWNNNINFIRSLQQNFNQMRGR